MRKNAQVSEEETDFIDLTPTQVAYPGVSFSVLSDAGRRSLQGNRRSRENSPILPTKSILKTSKARLHSLSPSRYQAPLTQNVSVSPEKPVLNPFQTEIHRFETDLLRLNLNLQSEVLKIREEMLQDLVQRQEVLVELEEMRRMMREKGRIEEIRNREMLTAYLQLEGNRKVMERVTGSVSPGKRRKERESPIEKYLVPSPYLEAKYAVNTELTEKRSPFLSRPLYFTPSRRPESYLSSKGQLSLERRLR